MPALADVALSPPTEGQRLLDLYYPSPEAQAAQRGKLAQIPVGIARGALAIPQLASEAVSAFPGLRGAGETVTTALEAAKPLPSGGVIERGLELGSQGAGLAAGLAFGLPALGLGAAAAGTVGTVATGTLFGASTYTQTRKHLEDLNTTLQAQGQPPLTDEQITFASLGSGAVLGAGQAVLSRFLRSVGGDSARDFVLSRLVPAGAKTLLAKVPGATPYVETALRDIPTFAGQAAATSAIERGVMSPEQLRTLEQAGQAPPSPLAAAGSQLGPAAIAAAPGAILRTQTQPRPMPAASGTPPPAAPETATPSAPTVRPLPFTKPTGVPERPIGPVPAPPSSTQRAMAAQFPTLPSTVINEALQQPPEEIQRRLTQLDTWVMERGYGEATPEELQPVLDRQAFYEALVYPRAEVAAGPTREQVIGREPFAGPTTPSNAATGPEALALVGQRPVPTQAEVAGIRPVAPPPVPRAVPDLGPQETALRVGSQAAAQAPYTLPVGPGETLSQAEIQSQLTGRPVGALPNALEAGLQRRGLPGERPSPPPETLPPFDSGGGVLPVTPPPPALEGPGAPAAPPAGETPTAVPATLTVPPGIVDLPLADIHTDPARFQYKRLATKSGATGSLTGSRRYNPLFAGTADVWLDPAVGQTYMVNGHNRRDMAERAGAPTMRVEYIQAGTAEEARSIGAMKNIAEGNGTALDAAKFFRDNTFTADEIAAYGINISGAIAREGLALSRLAPSLFGAVARGEVSEERGVIIGTQVPDHAAQLGLLRLLEGQERGGRRVSNDTLRELASMATSAPTQTTTQETLFGTDTQTQSLAVEKARLMAEMRKRLAGDKELFRRVGQASAAESLARVGNVINIEGSQAEAQQAAQLLDIFDRVKNLTGPVTQAFNDAVTRIAGGENATKVRADLYAQLGDTLPAALRGAEAERTAGDRPVAGEPGRQPSPSPDEQPSLLSAPVPTVSPEPASLPVPAEGAAVPGAQAPEQQLEAPAAETVYKGVPIRQVGDQWQFTDPEGSRRHAGSLQAAQKRIDLWAGHPGTQAQGLTMRDIDEGKTLTYKGYVIKEGGPGIGPSVYDPSGPRLASVRSLEDAKSLIDNDSRPLNLPDEPFNPPRPTGSLQVLQANAEAGKGPVTLAEVQRLFRGQEVATTEDGTLRVTMPAQGHILDIVTVTHITPTQAELELSAGQSTLGPTQRVLGRETPLGQGLFRIEVTPDRTTGTLFHEGEHFFEDSGLLTDKDIAALNRALQRQGQEPTAENRADLLAARLNANTTDIALSPLMRVVRKAQQFFDQLARLMGYRSTGQIVRRVESGAIFTRGGSSQLDLAALPPVAPGMVRLYRGESLGQGTSTVPEWVKADPTYQQMIEATGRWWTDRRELAAWYQREAPDGGHVVYQDVPVEVAQQAQLVNQPADVQRYAASRPGDTTLEREYFLPAAYRGQGQPVPARQGTSQLDLPPGPARLAPESKVTNPEGTLRVVYRGDPAHIEELDPEQLTAQTPAWGFFFATNPRQAEGYAMEGFQDVDRLDTELRRLRTELAGLARGDFQHRNSADQQRAIQQTQALIAQKEEALRDARGVQPTMQPVYLDIKNPLDLDANIPAAHLEAVRKAGYGDVVEQLTRESRSQPDASGESAPTGQDLYDALSERLDGSRAASEALYAMGIDGATHERYSDSADRVWVAFHPEQIIPVLGNPQQRRGRLQVVTNPTQPALPGTERPLGEERPPLDAVEGPGAATPRRAQGGYTPQVRATELTHYNSFTNSLPPDVATKVTGAILDGTLRPFQREVMTRNAIGQRAEEIQQSWVAHPEYRESFLRSLRTPGNPRRAGAADEFQSRALRDWANEHYLLLSAAHDQGVLSTAEWNDFQGKWSDTDGMASFATLVRSTAGRTLGDLSQPTITDLFRARMSELAQLKNVSPTDASILRQQLHDAYTANDFDRLRTIKDEIPNPTLAQLFWNFWYGSNMSNPATMSRKAWSVLSYTTFHNALVKPLAAGIDGLVSPIAGRERELYTTGVLPELLGTLGRIPQAAREAWWIWSGNERATAIPEMHFREGIEETLEPQLRPGNWRRATWNTDIPALGVHAGDEIPLMRRMAPFVDASTRAFTAMGVAFRHLAFDSQLEGLARTAAMRERGQADPAWEAQWVRDLSSHPEAMQQALDTSKQLTMQDAPGILSQWLTRGTQLPFPLGTFIKLLFPFRGTPDRLLARGLELLPGTTVVPWAIRNVEFQGWMPRFNAQAAFADPATSVMLAKQAIGTVMAAGLWALWDKGLITGAAPQAPDERDAFYRQGKIPYAANLVGNAWVEWQQFHPLSLPLGAAVSAFEAMTRLAKAHEGHPEMPTNQVYDGLALASVAAQSMIGNILEGSYFSGLASFFARTEQGRTAGDLPRGAMRMLVGATVPFVGLQRGMARTLDTLGIVPGTVPGQAMVRQPTDLAEMYLANSVFASQVKPRTDIFGQPQHFTMTPLEGLPFAPPARRGTAIESTMEDTLQRLQYFPGRLAKSDLVTGQAYAPELYDRMMARRGELLKPQLEQAVQQPTFGRLVPLEQKKALQAVVSRAGATVRREFAQDIRAQRATVPTP